MDYTDEHVPCCDLLAGLAGAQLGLKTPSPIHEGAFTTHKIDRVQWLATMAATQWFGGSKPNDDIELRNLFVCLSRVSLALFMRLRLVSVVGDFCGLADGPLTMMFNQYFPGGH